MHCKLMLAASLLVAKLLQAYIILGHCPEDRLKDAPCTCSKVEVSDVVPILLRTDKHIIY